MYVCHCQAVTDHTIGDVIERGAATIEEVSLRCGAGSDCGGCWSALEELLDEHLCRASRASRASRQLVDAHR
jgi:bacterioferritin-associated ferredoxin